ncbi:MAG: hypothetical protein GY751_00125 [Bacteroidetes bacterium]|nr:hypothetical protein [Bacteroidota bacterium]
MDKPDRKLELKSDLDEISAISWIGNKQLAAIQDEKGILYTVSTKNGEIKSKFSFGDKMDYEGLARRKDRLFALSSNGVLYTIDPKKVSSGEAPIRLSVESKAELEGICYDDVRKHFLLAYKTSEGISSTDQRHVYVYKAGRKYHSRVPFLTISNQKIRKFMERSEHQSRKLGELVDDHKSKSEAIFQPSDIAVHPITGHIYLVSAVNELLLVVDPGNKEIVYLHQFDKDHLNQPEGITFDSDGDLYISSEKGSASKARILRFEMDHGN